MGVPVDDESPELGLYVADFRLLVLEDHGHEVSRHPEELGQRRALPLQDALAGFVFAVLEGERMSKR